MSNENSERDTHFQGFAKLLYQELAQHTMSEFNQPMDTVKFMQEQRTIIARRAYDLMDHIMLYAPAAKVPDFTEWPEWGK